MNRAPFAGRGAPGPRALAATLALAAAACGAPPAETSAPPPPAPPPAPSAPKAPEPCDDGSCFRCGEGFCPPGFYCERPPATDRQACAWAPRCARAPSCSCLAPYLGGCRCEEREGAVYVSCD
jgi:hypothetical protein